MGLNKVILFSTVLIAIALSGCTGLKTGSIVEVGGGFDVTGAVSIGKVVQMDSSNPSYNTLVTMPQGWYAYPGMQRVSGYEIPMNTPYLQKTLNVYYVGETGKKEIDIVTLNYNPNGKSGTLGIINTRTLDNSFTIMYTQTQTDKFINY